MRTLDWADADLKRARDEIEALHLGYLRCNQVPARFSERLVSAGTTGLKQC